MRVAALSGAAAVALALSAGAVAQTLPKGDLSYIGCGAATEPGCTHVPAEVTGLAHVAASPDGRFVYATGGDRLVVLARSITTQALSYLECYGADPACHDTLGAQITHGPRSIAI